MKDDIGKGLLPENLEKDRANVLMRLSAAYRTILSEKTHNMGLWMHTRQHVTKLIRDRHASTGHTAPPMNLAALWARISLPGPSKDPNGHMRLVEALLTDAGPLLSAHIRYRMANHGNVHLEFNGPTGMGKSSCAVWLANWIKPIQTGQLVGHVSFDVSELPRKLKGKEPGDTVIQDEFVQMAGEGSRTFQSLFQNLEDTLRASQVNLFVLSPQSQKHGTTQAELELILWNPQQKSSRFIVWIQGEPHGVVDIPWMPDHLWQEYQPWKKANVERSVGGQFKDNTYLVRQAVKVFEDQRFIDYLVEAANKPKRADFASALDFFQGVMVSQGQADRMVDFMFNLCYNFERLKPKFQGLFGIQYNAGLQKVADKCTEVS